MREGQGRARAKALATGPLIRPATANGQANGRPRSSRVGCGSLCKRSRSPQHKFRAPESTEESALLPADQYDAPPSGRESSSLSPPSGRHGDCSSASLLRTSPARSALSQNCGRSASRVPPLDWQTSAIHWHLLCFAQVKGQGRRLVDLRHPLLGRLHRWRWPLRNGPSRFMRFSTESVNGSGRWSCPIVPSI